MRSCGGGGGAKGQRFEPRRECARHFCDISGSNFSKQPTFTCIATRCVAVAPSAPRARSLSASLLFHWLAPHLHSALPPPAPHALRNRVVSGATLPTLAIQPVAFPKLQPAPQAHHVAYFQQRPTLALALPILSRACSPSRNPMWRSCSRRSNQYPLRQTRNTASGCRARPS
jgi:hypothetical protein